MGYSPGKDMGPVEVLWDGDGVLPGKDMGPVEVLWDGDGVLPWKGHGISGSIMGWRWCKPPPPPPLNRHTHVKTTSRCTTYAGGKRNKTEPCGQRSIGIGPDT